MNSLPRQLLAANLRAIRHARRLTQDDLAALCGITRSYVSDVEHGKRNIGLDCLATIAQALGLTTSELLRNDLETGWGNPQALPTTGTGRIAGDDSGRQIGPPATTAANGPRSWPRSLPGDGRAQSDRPGPPPSPTRHRRPS
ncbi:MAG: helix-turn-helix domain-containing protein [Acidiferrobacter sp.]